MRVSFTSFHVISFLTLVAASNTLAQEAASSSNLIKTLINPTIADEIEMVDGQKKEIDAYVGELIKVRQGFAAAKNKDFNNAPASDRAKIERVYAERYQKVESRVAEKIKSTLLPFQIDRVEQLIRQKEFSEGDNRITGGLLSPKVIEYLAISDQQQERIEKKSEELKAEVEKEIRRVLERAKGKLLGELTGEQRKKYDALIGEPFEGRSDSSTTKEADAQSGN